MSSLEVQLPLYGDDRERGDFPGAARR